MESTANESTERELTPEEMERMIESQREISETVACLGDQYRRVKITAATRIDDIDSPHFEASGQRNKQRQQDVVEASKQTHRLASHGPLSPEQVGPIVDEMIIAINNDLMMSEATENLFGVCVPTESWHDMESDTIDDDLLGLLCYRAWQLLIRTPGGRELLLMSEGNDEQDTHDKSHIVDIYSYEAIKAVLSKSLADGRLHDTLERCVMAIPTEATDNFKMSCTEKAHLLRAIREGGLEWGTLKLEY